MEFGLIPNLEEFNFNSQQQIQVLNPLKESRGVQEQPDIKEIIKQEQKEAIEAERSLSKPSAIADYKEFVLTNLNFGFNNESKDFFVKAIRGDMENQYPTDEMMRLKAYLMEENRAS